MRAALSSFQHTAFGILLACMLATLPRVAVTQQAPATIRDLEFGQDHFLAGDTVDVTQETEGDVIAAGGKVTLNAAVAGDVLVAGNELRLAGPVQQGLLAAGREVVIAGNVQRNVRAAGATIRLPKQAQIGRNATLAGGELDLQGHINGHLLAFGKRIHINGTIVGDTQLTAQEIELGPDAHIQGNLKYRSPNELKRANTAQVGGSVERLAYSKPGKPHSKSSISGVLVWSLGLGILAAILLALMPAFARDVSDTIRTRLGMSLLLGFIALICIPVALIIALVSVVGIPLGLLALLLYPVLMQLGYVSAGIALGDMALARAKAGQVPSLRSRILAAVMALLALALLAQIPVAGGLLGLACMLIGTGAFLLRLRKARMAGIAPT